MGYWVKIKDMLHMHLFHNGLPATPADTGKCMNLHSSNCMMLHLNKVPKDKEKPLRKISKK